MKKILSIVLALTMILSLSVVFATNAVAADDEGAGMWTVLAHENEYEEDYEGDKTSIPGYKYDTEGFHTYGGEWAADAPYHLVQSKEAVNIQNGVYMEVRVDAYDYAAGDKWFNFNIWKDANLVPGSAEEKYGEGVQTLLRPGTADAETGAPGKAASVAWYINEFDAAGSSAIAEENRTVVEKEGKQYLTLTLTITYAASKYTVTINGAEAPAAVTDYMNTTFADGKAYIGFALHTSDPKGEQACTILKYGTSAETAKTPVGTDKAEPKIYNNTVAEIADPSTVPAGKPAILMTGDRANSHLKAKPSSATGAIVSITEDNLVHVNTNKATADFGSWSVDSNVSYSVEDFPIMVALTKNFCSCGMGAHADCMALESTKAYVMVGDIIAADPKHAYNELDICYDPYLIENGEDADNYLTFTLDFSDTEETGRFNGVRIDAQGVDLKNQGFNEFEMCWIGLFRTEEEATAFVEEYLTALGWINPDGEEETQPSGGDNTDTEAPVGTDVETQAPAGTEAETQAPAGTEAGTKAPASNNKEDNKNDSAATTEEGGCGSFVGFSAMAVVAVAAVAGMVSFKKKED